MPTLFKAFLTARGCGLWYRMFLSSSLFGGLVLSVLVSQFVGWLLGWLLGCLVDWLIGCWVLSPLLLTEAINGAWKHAGASKPRITGRRAMKAV